MKIFSTLFAIIFLYSFSIGQQASDYFPQQPGHKFYSKITPLDSLNNTIDTLSVYKVDSFAVVSNYKGRNANILLTKTGTFNTVNFLPYIDSEYVSFAGSDIYEYMLFVNLDLSFLDSLNIPFVGILRSLQNWYPIYRLAQNVDDEYTIFTRDTSLIIDSTTVPIRLQFKAKRLADENLNTQIGNFPTKKFLTNFSISYLVSFPPFPPIPFEIVAILDTIWIAPGNWIVKSLVPSTNVDLSFLGSGNIFIPGTKREAIPPIQPTDINDKNIMPGSFTLEQNYPNPFNPSTRINFSIPSAGLVSLKIFDVIGNEIDELLNKSLSAGNHSVTFDSKNYDLSTGLYFYQIQFNNKILTKKMLLIK